MHGLAGKSGQRFIFQADFGKLGFKRQLRILLKRVRIKGEHYIVYWELWIPCKIAMMKINKIKNSRVLEFEAEVSCSAKGPIGHQRLEYKLIKITNFHRIS